MVLTQTSCKISYSLYYLQGLDISGYTHDDVVLNESNNGNVKDAIEELIHNHHAPVIEKNDTRLSHLLETIDTYSYEYDLESQSFIKTNCDALRYLWKKPMLTVADFLMLKGLDQIQQRPLEDFEEDDEVWPLYCKHKEAWDDLCEILSNDAKQEDDLATFTKEKEAKQTLHYILPHFLQGSVEKILNNLKEHQFIDAYIMKNEYSDAFEVTIEEHYDHQEQFTQLFSFVEALMDEKGLSITYDGPQHVYIKRNSLHVRHVAIQSSEVMMLLKKLNEKHFFIQFSCHDDVVRLVYRSPSIKELLIDRQAIIMRHVEHICLTQTSLDDYAVLDNECCVMLISGFKVINIIYENDRNHLINTLDFEGVYFIIIGDTNEVINDHMRKVGWNNL